MEPTQLTSFSSQRDAVKCLVKESRDSTLYKLDSIASVRNWDYSLPTLVQKGRFTARMPWTTSKTFTNELFRKYPLFKDIDLSGLAIYGGFVADEILGLHPNDIDMAVVSETGNAVDRIKKLVDDIQVTLKKDNERLYELDLEQKRKKVPAKDKIDIVFHDLAQLNLRRYKDVYTFTVPSLSHPIQIVDKRYSNLQELLSNSDLACTSVAYYEGEILFSAEGRFSFENLAVPVHGTDRSPEFVQRLQKYFTKGFDIILPNLDMEKIPKRNLKFDLSEVIDLPFANIIYSELNKNKICTSQLKPVKQNERTVNIHANYNRGSALTATGIHHNITCLIRNKFDDFICEGTGDKIYDAFSDHPVITDRMITNVYETVKTNLLGEDALNISVLDKYFSNKNVADVFQRISADFRKTDESSQEQLEEDHKTFIEEEMSQLVSQQTEETILLNQKFQAQMKDNKVPKSTSSITERSATVTPQEWYGQYYTDI